MAEVVCELGVKSPKKHQNTKSPNNNNNNNNMPVNFLNQNSKKDSGKKELANKAIQLDSEAFKTNISSQKSKHNYQDEGKAKNITADGGPSTNSTFSSKENQENGKDHVKYNKELVNGFDIICSTNAKVTEKLKEHDKKVKSKKGNRDLNNTKETEDVLDLEQ